jgi:hypothetical protein
MPATKLVKTRTGAPSLCLDAGRLFAWEIGWLTPWSGSRYSPTCATIRFPPYSPRLDGVDPCHRGHESFAYD